MVLKTRCDSCGTVVIGVMTSLRNIKGQYLCPTCAKVATGQLSAPSNLRCPYCQSDAIVLGGRKFTTLGIIVLAGILLVPVIIGLILVYFAFRMREVVYRCYNCKKSF
jgi:DNA-directed RNA polymerase subunit RPC12/RpoP